jgi:hypothetical protein
MIMIRCSMAHKDHNHSQPIVMILMIVMTLMIIMIVMINPPVTCRVSRALHVDFG